MARSVGIDAVEIARVREARNRHGAPFEEKILSPAERAILAASATPDQFLAGRFAAKEAVMKVLGTGWAKGIRFPDIEVLRDGDGVPLVSLSDAADVRARSLGIGQIFVSITHTRELAMAVAVAE
jgi:holo-[acyl-carrier protein] synthase